ncbi:Fip1 motif/Zinc finger C-x8-C-x5-C-x3-H type (and similar)/CCCH-type zinc finger containing protein, putative [Angomonas deanei]|uniref:Fip1 motif/Zinc finger C-x8-C-x5-C-x3-H type (And similar)/CCCH-type zinc finger containing protein, putative n=1 Tax=Angomonas deanei TaxID=59799 RepID=A0A7G2CU99_9TRYP|nr:Fip1 motif/Zinc finger C-x8-C-x5-C-x3-H type (and similar)/CCCH-type zinc finger containing protein, putative [Angomonas deanei]
MEQENDLFVVNDNEYEEAPAHSESDEEPVGSVEDLIPLCVKRHKGPLISTATFGYDIEEMSKRPWSQPGAKLSDYFNYGFDETTWRLYCAMQKDGEASLLQKAQETLQKLKISVQGETAEQPDAFNPNAYNQYGNNDYQRGNFRQPGNRMSAYKTKMCQSFLEGNCPHGDNCNFAHGEHDLRTNTNTMDNMRGNYGAPYNFPQAVQPDDYRTTKRYRREGDQF